MSEKPVIARLDIPADALVVYEHMVVRDPDRTGNWRYYIRRDGCVFNTHNTQLFITDPAQFERDDPALFWSTPFGAQPDRCLTLTQQAELQQALAATQLSKLKGYYPATQQRSSPIVERWTLALDGQTPTIVVEQGSTPPELATLKTVLSDLIRQAPRPT